MQTHKSPAILLCLFLLLYFFPACKQKKEPGSTEHIKTVTTAVDDKALLDADKNPGNWLSYGRNYSEDRFSPLDQINKENVNGLGLAWSLDLGFKRGFEATPVVVDGIMFATGTWSKVYAIDVRTGKLIWTFDPKVPGRFGVKACCDVVNRGIALYKGKVFVGTIDGRLIAVDAANGNSVWETWTVDTTKKYTITGAPRVVKGKVIIGNSGAEFGVRGYITAYDTETGKQVWRFYTVPGDPSKPFESKAMEMAAKTWTGEWWKYGGGGTCWDAMAYDPELNLFYVGIGNGSPWSQHHRSPDGGDNLFLSSIVALNPDNGEYVWHYQTTPGDHWDYTATQPLILADLEIESKMRKVIMQAPKNGFFYVIDRTNGKFISAKPIAYINWAKGMSPEGRPIESDFARMKEMNVQIIPGPEGIHNWHPMAYNPKNKLVYIPIKTTTFDYGFDSSWKFNALNKEFGAGTGWNIGADLNPAKPFRKDPNAPTIIPEGWLLAWDPVHQKEAWKVKMNYWRNGGVLATETGLIFHGTGDGKLVAFDSDNGKIVWQVNVGTGVVAAPISYMVDGIQYISICVGWGGGPITFFTKGTENIYPARIFTFKIDGKELMPDFYKQEKPTLLNIDYPSSEDDIKKGADIYFQYCFSCHGEIDNESGALPDLGHMQKVKFDVMDSIVLKGMLEPLGMPNLGNKLTVADVENLKKFISAKVKELRKQN